ncbi:hypothetical protein BDZ97DRAFT_998939 [Flammula alnicola]|nr:hypothetical protein BDZ97DRAFT_998939 [Flammula alnicola]
MNKCHGCQASRDEAAGFLCFFFPLSVLRWRTKYGEHSKQVLLGTTLCRLEHSHCSIGIVIFPMTHAAHTPTPARPGTTTKFEYNYACTRRPSMYVSQRNLLHPTRALRSSAIRQRSHIHAVRMSGFSPFSNDACMELENLGEERYNTTHGREMKRL